MNDQFEKWVADGPPSLKVFEDELGRLDVRSFEDLLDLLRVATDKPWEEKFVKVINTVLSRLALQRRANAEQDALAAKIRKIRPDESHTKSENKR